jgi:hypothetical protein
VSYLALRIECVMLTLSVAAQALACGIAVGFDCYTRFFIIGLRMPGAANLASRASRLARGSGEACQCSSRQAVARPR